MPIDEYGQSSGADDDGEGPAPGDGGSSITVDDNYLSVASVAVLDVVYQTATGNTIDRADATARSTMPAIGLCYSKPTATTAIVRKSGTISGFVSLSPGVAYYVAKGTPGGIVSAASLPTAPAAYQQVGIARTTTILDVTIDETVTYDGI